MPSQTHPESCLTKCGPGGPVKLTHDIHHHNIQAKIQEAPLRFRELFMWVAPSSLISQVLYSSVPLNYNLCFPGLPTEFARSHAKGENPGPCSKVKNFSIVTTEDWPTYQALLSSSPCVTVEGTHPWSHSGFLLSSSKPLPVLQAGKML